MDRCRTPEYAEPRAGPFSIHYGGPIVIEPGTGAHNALQESGWGGNTVDLSAAGGNTWHQDVLGQGRSPAAGAFPLVKGTEDLTEGSEVDLGGLKTTACGGKGERSARGSTSPTTPRRTRTSKFYVDLCRGYNGTQNKDDENTEKCANFERQIANFQPTTPGSTSGFTVISGSGDDAGPRVSSRGGNCSRPHIRPSLRRP